MGQFWDMLHMYIYVPIVRTQHVKISQYQNVRLGGPVLPVLTIYQVGWKLFERKSPNHQPKALLPMYRCFHKHQNSKQLQFVSLLGLPTSSFNLVILEHALNKFQVGIIRSVTFLLASSSKHINDTLAEDNRGLSLLHFQTDLNATMLKASVTEHILCSRYQTGI